MGFAHIPVLLEDVTANLVTNKTVILVDATVGGGGHSSRILERHKQVRLIGIDTDDAALAIAGERLRGFGERVTLVRGNFKNVKEILSSMGVLSIDGILFDLGLSTIQITGGRGFSFNDDAFLDMRMDNRAELTAYDVVNGYSYDKLLKIISEYGEEYRAPRIVGTIAETRKKRPIATAKELADIVCRAKRRTGRMHPATKTFQAIRMEVNGELKNIDKGVDEAIDILAPEGRIGVISFHSLEDRIIKNKFKNSPLLMTITKKPYRPEREEIRENPSARSAKLRIAEKI